MKPISGAKPPASRVALPPDAAPGYGLAMAHALRSTALFVLVFSMGGCAFPPGDLATPEGCYYQWIQARESGNSDAIWELLSERDQKSLDDWHKAERESFRRIDLLYPDQEVSDEARAVVAEARKSGVLAGALLQVAALHSIDKKVALEAIDYGVRSKLDGAKGLLRHLMSQAQAPPLPFLQRMGAFVRNVEVEGTRAKVNTWAGDAFDFEASKSVEGNLWRHALSGEERRGLDAASKQAQDNLKIVEGNLVAIQGTLPSVP
jgi:hypothetical protein